MKIVATNRKARHQYHILSSFNAGIELKGMEVKSLRLKGASLDGSFCRVEKGELLVSNMHIPEYGKSSFFKSDVRRDRKLLLHKREIKKLENSLISQGMTIVPLKVYFNERNLAKIEIAVVKGKQLHDKRKQLKDDAVKKDIQRDIKSVHTVR
ncbi:MAG: SsrA-binding protein SmpB [Candidatus Omnitrophica bacterium]|nr:SsrA-binding protein SmpB [Candidatus Omnitrophota bacterium]MDD5081252.1 SsrA-binding protein SmpB [Candidatus Omnitrophota bacterium]MDD5441556.1 SsrA-binding protein SmpB [Candidatus Omnitrophota bacterium]